MTRRATPPRPHSVPTHRRPPGPRDVREHRVRGSSSSFLSLTPAASHRLQSKRPSVPTHRTRWSLKQQRPTSHCLTRTNSTFPCNSHSVVTKASQLRMLLQREEASLPPYPQVLSPSWE